MNVMITGAGGFVGRNLVEHLLRKHVGPAAIHAQNLTLVDIRLDAPADERVQAIEGDLSDASLIASALRSKPDVIIHLASVPGGSAERDYLVGRKVNLDGTRELIEQAEKLEKRPRFVFASSVAVFGSPQSSVVDEDSQPAPKTSYGAHKLIGEILVEDASRRGWIDGVSLRLPGVVARPPGPSGLVSSFMSDVFWRVRDGRPITLPVSPDATSWWISVQQCVKNLIIAAGLDTERLGERRTLTMPVLHLTMCEVVGALAKLWNRDPLEIIRYQPDPGVETLFGRCPPLVTPRAHAIGLRHDGSVDELVRRVFQSA
ncbi:NAD-dependent epimerase/dehydratase family protein [Cupriavidus metallidurans]|uniref:NAD-dependent epimerase/dehydratase family protein n=1 Tax=Cupriavidus metallidurans TaxID=119219 RepID=UPI001CD02449|nr:NAD-dependent epimerase/dehydratase family protein [Cupriavidus metallidurans]UBM09373.1 NAD-dependent epimerase/dehydratase family protein [Cupriavidus metallidurans]